MNSLKRAIAVAVVLTICGCTSLRSGSTVGEEDIQQKIRDAQTPADHQAIAAFYAQEAQAAYQHQAQHLKMQDAYAAIPALMVKSGAASHCNAIARKYQEIAKEYEALAELHKNMAEASK